MRLALWTGARRSHGPAAGHTLLELLAAVAIMAVVSAAAAPGVLAGLESSRTHAAARYLAARLQVARAEAIRRGTHVGLRIEPAEGYRYTCYVDGNEDGLLTRDIVSGVDQAMGAPERLDSQFAGVTFGILDGVTEVDSHNALPAGSDPVRLGSSDILSFGPLGTATAGTLYLHGRGHDQFAVRVLGTTGRVRVLRFDRAAGEWVLP